jgi:hypothetical protein
MIGRTRRCGDGGVVTGWEGLIWDMRDFESDAIH